MQRKTIGIPRALFYYYLFPLWETFFQELGFAVVLSPLTDKRIVDIGVQKAVDEVCYPVKIYYGHVATLADRVDYLFLPRLISIEKKSFICPKFMGLPDMIRASFPNLPPLLDQTFDDSKKDIAWHDGFQELGQKLGCAAKDVRQAYRRAFARWKEYQAQLLEGRHPLELLDGFKPRVKGEDPVKIGLLGHGYNLYDRYASMNIVKKLHDLGAEVVTAEMVPDQVINEAAGLLPKKIFWTLGHKVVGSALHLAGRTDVAGLVHVASFGCGPDSMTGEILQRLLRRHGQKPLLNLTIDEHTGEAGLDTRLEAFMDMINRRKAS